MCAAGIEGVSPWESGISARSSTGSWSYPSGITAHRDQGSWSYPSGITAKSSRGTRADPHGISVGDEGAMIVWVCEQDPKGCEALGRRLRSTEDPLLREALLVQAAWAQR